MAFAATEAAATRLRALKCRNVRLQGDTALSLDVASQIESVRPRRRSTESMRFISVGRLVPFKAFHFGLRAFARADIEGAEYWVVGQGPDRERLEREARDLGIADQVRFLGQLSRRSTIEAMARCHALIHPSLRESGGWVCIEAMAVGLPVFCVDSGGPALIVSEETGFKIPSTSPEQLVEGIADGMQLFDRNRELLVSMGRTAQERVRSEFLWPNKVNAFNSVYTDLISPHRRT